MAIGDLVGTLVAVGGTATSFVLTNNPGGFFAVSGSRLIEAVDTPDGIYPITIKAIGPGYQATTSFSLDFTGIGPIPPPVGEFFIGINITGAQTQTPVFPSAACVNYYAQRLNGSGPFRFPIGWSINQSFPPFATVGIQPTAFGPLDTTSNYLTYAPFGPNLLKNSNAIASPPWVTFAAGTATISITANAGVAPDGTNTATLISLNRSDTGSQAQTNQSFQGSAVPYTGSIYLQAHSPGDVGKVIAIALWNGSSIVQTSTVTLTNSWVRYTITGTLAASPSCQLVVGYQPSIGGTGAVGVLASQAMINIGSSADSYQATVGGYLGALDLFVANVVAAGAQCFIDCHMFGNGPGGVVGSGAVPISAFADLWTKIATHYVSQPDLLAGIYGFDIMNEWPNGFDSTTIFNASQAAITAIRNAGFTGFIIVEGTNFSSAWNWTTGGGQPFNSSGLFALIDPLNKLIMSPHMYPDADDSWSQPTSFGYVVNAAVPGTAPVGLNTNPMIGVERMEREYGPWARGHGLATILGEYGSSDDTPWKQGTFDFVDWNVITRNLLTYLQTNKMGFTIWSGGPGFQTGYSQAGYAGSLDPASTTLLGQPDFVNGVQHPAMVVLDEFTGYSGPQPQAYALIPAAPNQQFYCTIGTPTQPFTVYYGGLITSPVTITPHATLTDLVTPVSGTFSPTSLTASPGQNFVGQFTFTAGQAATIVISTTNSFGWIDPPGIGISSIVDGYVALPGSPSNIYGMYNRYTPNIGPSVRLQRADGQQMDWGFTLPNSTGYNGFDRLAIQNWAGVQSGIEVVELYGIGPGQQNPIPTSGQLTLNLQNAAGYPQLEVNTVNLVANFNTPAPGKTKFYTITRMNQSSATASGLWRMDWDIGPLNFGTGSFQVFSTGFNLNGQTSSPAPQYPRGDQPGGFNVALSMGVVNNAYHEYGVSYDTSVSNGFATYKDGSLVAQATVDYQLTTDNNAASAQFASFKSSPSFWIGALYHFEIGMGFALSAAQHASIDTIDNTYYSTPLPDGPLPSPPPTITGALTNLPIYPGFIPARPFGLLVISDPSGGATDTVTITLTGAAGTLSGSGISGTGPYTVGPDTPANVTAVLNDAVFTTAAGVGSTTNFALSVLSSSGGTGSNNSTNTTVSTYSTQASFTPPAGTFTSVNHSGYNFAGGELDAGSTLGPSHTQMDYLASKGFGLFRYVMTSKFLYTTAFGQLNTTYLAAMKGVIDYAFTKNLYVVIDPHDSGFIWDSSFGNGKQIQPSMRSQDLFQDFWRRVATAFLNYPNVIFGLMNEPTIPATRWRDGGVTPPITAIRAVGATQLILIPGTGQSSALGWSSNGNTAAFAGYSGDPLSNFAFEAHQYLDSSASGGGSVATLNGSTILNTFNSFLTANTFKGFVGEFGMAPDPFICNPPDTLHFSSTGTSVTTNSITANSNMLSVMVSSGLYVGWAAWGGGYEFATPPVTNGYAFNPEPERTGFPYILPIVDQPQIAPLLSFLI